MRGAAVAVAARRPSSGPRCAELASIDAAPTRRRTATCSTSTTTWPQEFDLRMRVVARQVATVVVFDVAARRAATVRVVRPPVGRARRCCVVDGVVAVDVHVGDRTATELVGAGRPAAAAGSRRADDLLERTSDVARARAGAARAARRRASPSASGRGRRSRTCSLRRAGRRARRPRRAARDHVPAAPRGAPGAAALAPRRALGAASSRAGSASRCPLTHRLLGRLVGAERPSVSHALARLVDARASSPAATDELAPARHAGRTIWPPSPSAPDERGRRRGAHHGAARRVTLRRSSSPRARPQTEQQLVHVIWMTSGLGCDGESVALTAATSPSLEDLLRGTIPGMPGHRHLQPAARLRVRRRLRARPGTTPSAGKLEPFVLVVEGSIPNEEINGDGHWAGFGVDPETRPADPDLHLDRPARAEGRGRDGRSAPARPTAASRRCATTRPARWGSRDYLGAGWRSRLGHADRQPARLPGAARQHHRDAAAARAASSCGVAPDRSTSTSRDGRAGCSSARRTRAATAPASPSTARVRRRRSATTAPAWSSSAAAARS